MGRDPGLIHLELPSLAQNPVWIRPGGENPDLFQSDHGGKNTLVVGVFLFPTRALASRNSGVASLSHDSSSSSSRTPVTAAADPPYPRPPLLGFCTQGISPFRRWLEECAASLSINSGDGWRTLLRPLRRRRTREPPTTSRPSAWPPLTLPAT